MTYEEFKRHLGKAGLTIKEFASLIKCNTNSITNYRSSDEVPNHLAVTIALMGEMADQGLDFKNVIARIVLKPKKARGVASKGNFGGNKQMGLFPEL